MSTRTGRQPNGPRPGGPPPPSPPTLRAMPEGPVRLRLPPVLAPVFAAAGWTEDDAPAPGGRRPARRPAPSGPDPDGALGRLGALFAAHPGLGEEALADPRLGRALVALAGASPALSRPAAFDPEALRRAVAGAPRRSLRRAVRRPAGSDGRHPPPSGRPPPRRRRRRPHRAPRHARRRRGAERRRRRGRRRRPGRPSTRPAGLLPFTVVAMGKWGGRELNYASDIDLLFVYGVPERRGPRGRRGTGAAPRRRLPRLPGPAHPRRHRLSGRRRPAAGGARRAAGPHRRFLPGLLGALGPPLGVAGAHQGPRRGRGPRAGPGLPRGGRALRVPRDPGAGRGARGARHEGPGRGHGRPAR